MRADPDHLEEAFTCAASPPRNRDSDIPTDRAIAALRGQFKRVLAELPDDWTVADMREALEDDTDPAR